MWRKELEKIFGEMSDQKFANICSRTTEHIKFRISKGKFTNNKLVKNLMIWYAI